MTTTNDRLAEIRARLTESGEIENKRNNNLTFLLSLVDQLQVQLDDRNNLIHDLHDPGPCLLDHHGYCQEHNWFETDPPCPDARAQALVQALGVPGDR